MAGKTILVFAPHPDDAEFMAGGTLARFAAEGAKILIVTVTDGCKGSLELDGKTLATLRKEEAKRAAAILGASEPLFLGYGDFELEKTPIWELRSTFIGLIRQHKPDIAIAEDIHALLDIHPDHRMVAQAAYDALQYSALPLICPEFTSPHFVAEKYFSTQDSARINKVVDISAYFGKKIAAMAEHKTQVKFLVDDIFNQAHYAGIDLSAVLGEMANDHLSALTFAMQSEALEIGQKAGVAMGEGFHYVRFNPLIEAILANPVESA